MPTAFFVSARSALGLAGGFGQGPGPGRPPVEASEVLFDRSGSAVSDFTDAWLRMSEPSAE